MKVSPPNLPANIKTIKIMRLARVKEGVSPIVSPTVPTAETTVNSDKVVEKDGLNIHCANGASETDSDSEKPQNTNAGYFAHLNMPALIVLVCIASAVIIAGVILLFSTKIEIKKREK